MRWLALAAALALGACTVPAVDAFTPDYGPTQTFTLPAIDGRPITAYLDAPSSEQAAAVPLVVVVDGSGCMGQLRASSADFYRPASTDARRPFARLMVEKPGVAPDQEYTSACSEDFLRHYSIDQRVFDHLRVLQHLRAQRPEWWNGELLVWGWSDGEDIAAQLVAYDAAVDRAVLGAMGGGLTMAEHFRDYWQCPTQMDPANRPACLADLEATLTDIRDNPTWRKTWSGADNTHKVWATRLDSRLSHVLADNRTPILIVQGERDLFSTPVQSARALVADLEAANNTAFTYWEVPNMRHGWRRDTDEGFRADTHGKALQAAMLQWLLTGEAEADDLAAAGLAQSSGSSPK